MKCEDVSRAGELAIIESMVGDICLTVCLVGIAWAIAWVTVKLNE